MYLLDLQWVLLPILGKGIYQGKIDKLGSVKANII